MAYFHLLCLEEEEKEYLDESPTDSIEDPFLGLVGSGIGYIDVQMGPSLVEAAKLGHLKCVQTLLEAGADVNTVDILGNTPISESAAFDRVECLKLLVKEGADVNIRNKTGDTPLLRAMSQLNRCVELLVEAGADLNVVVADDQTESSLIKAAKVGHEKCVEIFTKAGVDVNTIDAYGNTPIAESVENGNVECLQLLVKAGANVNTTNKAGESPVLRATFKQNNCVEVLIEAGADVNFADNSGYSPIIVAASCGNCKQVELLIKAGADVNARTKAEGDVHRYFPLTPGTTALIAASYFHKALSTVKVLLQYGAHVNIRNEIGLNAFENTYSGDYQSHGRPLKETLTLLHAAGETTDGTKKYEFDISGITFTRLIEFPEYLRERHLNLTLKEVCRETIRKHLLDINPHLNLFVRIPQLGLPSRLTHYLLYEEDLKINEGDLN